MKCSECPGLNRSYLACSHGIRHTYFIDEEIDCRTGEALRAKQREQEEFRLPAPWARPAPVLTRAG